MRKRFSIYLALLVLGSLALLVWQVARAPARVFHGKTETYWIKSLSNYQTQDQALEWRAQIEQWKTFGTSAVPTLIKALQEGNGPQQKAYARVWRKLPPYLQSRLSRPASSAQLHVNVLNVLCEMSPDAKLAAVPGVVHALDDDESPAVRCTAIHFLNDLPKLDKTTRELVSSALVRAIQDKDPETQCMALNAVSWCGEKPEILVPAIEKVLRDTNAMVRISGVRALRQVAPNAVAEVGGVALLLACLTNKQAEARSQAAVNLGYMGAEPATVVPALIKALSDKDENVRTAAARGLAGFGPKAEAAAPALLKLREDPKLIARVEATNALQRICPKTAALPYAR